MNVLLIEDDELMRTGMTRALRDWGAEVTAVSTEQEGMIALNLHPELLITDIRLPNKGSGIAIVEAAAKLRPTPLMIAISGKASPLESFRLAQAGVAAFIAKPFDFIKFIAAIEAVIENPPDLTPHLASQVGRHSYHDILQKVRREMLEQALARASGNRVHAAKLLDVSRQAVQQLIKDFSVQPYTHPPQSGYGKE